MRVIYTHRESDLERKWESSDHSYVKNIKSTHWRTKTYDLPR